MQTTTLDNVQLDRISDSTTPLEGLVKTLSEQEAKLRYEIEANPIRFDVIEDSTVLGAGDDKRRLMGTVTVFAGTFAFLLLAFAYHEFRARKIDSVDEIVHGLGMNLVGTVPATAARNSAIRAAAGDVPEHSTFAEAIDATRVMLLRAARSDSLRVVMVTSASSGEGKTSLSTHLAASLAQANLRTLLIDGDLRNPIMQQVFGLELAPGFCELLRGETTVEAVIRTTSVDGLSLIPAGRWSGGTSRALAQDGVASGLLSRFREEYDFVIIDSSPVLPVVDPLLIGQLADGTILSVLRDVSRMPNVYAAHQRLTAGGVRVLGEEVSGVRGEAYGGVRIRIGPAWGRRSSEGSNSRSIVFRIFPTVTAFAGILVAGLIPGLWAGRWASAASLEVAAGRLSNVPFVVGEWTGRDLAVDPREQATANANGFLRRRYANSRTGSVVTVLLLCGRPGPLSLHTPDICYAGAGFEGFGKESRYVIPESAGNHLWVHDFQKALPSPLYLRVFYGWSTNGTWDC